MKAFKIAFHFLPMLIAVLDELGGALKQDSPGGKKVTKEEWAAVGDAFKEKLLAKIERNPGVVAKMLDQDDDLDMTDVLAGLE